MKSIETCRICGGLDLAHVMSLGSQYLTGRFPKSASEMIARGPVDLVRCNVSGGCGLVQLLQSYDLSEMYGDTYGYRSGLNASMVRHLHDKVAQILALGILEPGDLVIDIGSNDATTLRAYPAGRYDCVGIDPTGVKFAAHYPPGVRLVAEFFSAAAARKAAPRHKAKVITSFSMFYDLEDPVAFAREVAETLDDDGIWVFEQSYLPAMLRANSFDTICHEHLEFYGVAQIEWIAAHSGLKILDVDFNDVNGGSASIVAAKAGCNRQSNRARIDSILADEHDLGLTDGSVFIGFRQRVEAQRKKMLDFLADCQKSGKRVCGLGASTKGNVLLQYYGIGPQQIESIGEVNEDKFDAYTPGSLIPIRQETDVLASNPDYLVVLPWHFRQFFLDRESLRGRNIVFPLPEFEIVRV